jgi:hypothetical protein
MWIATLVGYLFFHHTSSSEPGGKNKFDQRFGLETSLKFPVYLSKNSKKWVVHIHHWLWCLFCTLFYPKTLIYYFCLGGLVQGLTYPDWYQVVYNEHIHKKEI